MGGKPRAPRADDTVPARSSESGAGAPAVEPQALLVQVLGVVAAGIGVLGFVTFFGGAILWIRFDQAELPANEAVAVVPREVLLTTGASFLVPALMLALAAVLAVVLLRAVRDTYFQRQPAVAPNRGSTPKPGHHGSVTGFEDFSPRNRFLAEGAFLLGLLAVEVAWVAPEALTVSIPRTFFLALFGFATLAISWFVLHGTERVLWFGVALFAAVSAFIAATTYVRTTDRPKLEPAALLRAGEGPRTGFFVARAADYVYLGRGNGTTRTPGGARLVAVPSADVTDLSIGPLVSPALIGRRAARLALGLCRSRTAETTQSRQVAAARCSRAQLENLNAQARQRR
jgi:hypothetical protein